MKQSARRATADRPDGDRFLVLRNLVFSGAHQASTYVLGLLTIPYLIRALGPAGYGGLAFSLVLNAYGWLIVDWGFSNGGTREVAANRDDPEKLRTIFWSVMSAKSVLAVGTAVALSIFALATPSPGPEVTLAPLLLNLVGGVLSVDWFVRGFEKMGWYAATTIAGRAATLLLLFLLVHRPEDLWIAAILNAVGGIVGSLAGLTVVRRLAPLGRPRLNVRTALAKVAENRHYFLINSNALIYSSAAPIVLNLMAGTVAVGFYAAGDKLMRVAASTMAPVGSVMYPRTVSLLQTDRRAAARSAGRSLLLQAPIAVSMTLVLFFGADLLTRKIMGPQMMPAADIVRWLSLMPIIFATSRVLTSQMLYPLGFARETSQVIYATSPLYVIALIVFGKFLGAQGGAIAFVLTEGLQMFLFLILAWRKERTYLLDACNWSNLFARS